MRLPLELVIKLRDEATSRLDRVKSHLSLISSRTKTVTTDFINLDKETKLLSERLRLFGLIGLGTLSALFMTTPLLKAGFDLLRASLTVLFLKMQADVLPVFKIFSDIIMGFAEFLDRHPFFAELVKHATNLAIMLAVVTIPMFALSRIIVALINQTRRFASGIGRLIARLGGFRGIASRFRRISSLLGRMGRRISRFGRYASRLSPIFGRILRVIGRIAFPLLLAWNMFKNLRKATLTWKGILEAVLKGLYDFMMDLLLLPLEITKAIAKWLGKDELAKKFGHLIKFFREDLWKEGVEGFKLFIDNTKKIMKKFFDWIKSVWKTLFKIPKLSLKRRTGGEIEEFQHGGIVTRPTIALVGEREPEAVIPLSKLHGFGGIKINVNFENVKIASGMDLDTFVREMTERISTELSRRYLLYR